MYLILLIELYYEERKKLEGMWIYQQESKLKLIKLRKTILKNKIENLRVSELAGREDIADEIKEKLFLDRVNEGKIEDRLGKNLDSELSEIEGQEKEELRKANYSAFEYADYIYQLEKVTALESELELNRLFPEDLYQQQKEIKEIKNKKEV